VKRLLVLFLVLSSVFIHAQGNPSAEDVKQLKACEAAYSSTKAVFLKKKDPASKKKFVAATVKFGTAAMMSDVLDRKLKYRKALHLYREALKLDPANKEAKNNSDMIVSIYKSMGRPVPQ
jgi:hypothetical protein